LVQLRGEHARAIVAAVPTLRNCGERSSIGAVMKTRTRTTKRRSTCPMCGQPLTDEHAGERVAGYETRVEARLLRRLMPRAIAEAEAKFVARLAQATHEADDLRRKLEAKSARSLGEEQQDALLARLEKAFPDDQLVLVANNGTGDILQTVRSRGREVGRILHESKNTKQWSNGWVAKVKQDGATRHASHLVIESRRLPRGARGYCERDGVLICQPDYAEALTHVLRMWMIATCVEDGAVPDEGRLWAYLDGNEFRGHLETLRKATGEESDALVAEERAHKRWWDARAVRAGTIRNAVVGIEGDIQEIVDASQERAPRTKPPAGDAVVPA
jgi:hypothetical protein